MMKNNQYIIDTVKTIPASEFPSYIRQRSLTNNIYCILDIAKDKKLYPYLKHGDWHYYWFNKNWKLFEKVKGEEINFTAPCLITLDPRKISVRRYFKTL